MLSPEFIAQTGMAEGLATELNTFIESNKIDATQEAALQSSLLNFTADIKKNYDGKANEQAEGILSGAAKLITDKTGISRNQGEKLADFMHRAGGDFFTKKEQALMTREGELLAKINAGNTDAIVKTELEETKRKLDALLQKEASIDELISGDYKNKYETISKENESLKERTAFASAKPLFPKEVNPYEASAIWKEVQGQIKESYKIELNSEGEAVCIDKTNEHRTLKLSDVVAKNEKIVALLKGRQQEGLNHKKFDVQLEGIPFAIPENATATEIQKSIKDYLTTEKRLLFTSDEYAREFASLNIKIKQQQQKTA